MAGSFNPNDMELTPAIVKWKPHGSTAVYDLGGTLSDIKINFAYEKADIKADQFGSTPLDKRVSGVKVSVVTEITQVNDFQEFGFIFPHASVTGTAPYDGLAPSAAIVWNNTVGSSDLAVAGVLTLHPQNRASGDSSYDWTFFQASPTEISEITYSPTKQSVFKVEWTVFPDTSVNPARFFKFGGFGGNA